MDCVVMPCDSMVQTSTEYPISRRKALALGGTLVLTPVAGCEEQASEISGDGGEQSAENGYATFSKALAEAGAPWRRTPEELTAEMMNAIVSQLTDLGKAAIRGKTIGALKAIIDATKMAFEQLHKAQRQWNIQQYRVDATASAVGSEVESYYPAEYSFDSNQPFYPLFDALRDGYAVVADKDTEENREVLRSRADSVNTVFTAYYHNYINQNIPDPDNPSPVSEITGDETLSFSLRFLHQSAKWTRNNI